MKKKAADTKKNILIFVFASLVFFVIVSIVVSCIIYRVGKERDRIRRLKIRDEIKRRAREKLILEKQNEERVIRENADRIMREVKLPSLLVLPNSLLAPVYDQLQLQSCIANSVCYVFNYYYFLQYNKWVSFSRLYVYYWGRLQDNIPPTKDSGFQIRSGIKAVKEKGLIPETQYPYSETTYSKLPDSKLTNTMPDFSYYAVNPDLKEIKVALKNGYPIIFGLALYESFFKTGKNGFVASPNTSSEKSNGGHAMTIWGWDDPNKQFLVLNSWGYGAGANGWYYIPYDVMLNRDLAYIHFG